MLLQSLLNNHNAFHAANNAEATTTTTINSPSPLLSYPQERLVSVLMQFSERGGAVNAADAATIATSPHLTPSVLRQRIMDQLLLHTTSSSTPRNVPTPSSAEVPITTSTTDDRARNADKSMKEEDD